MLSSSSSSWIVAGWLTGSIATSSSVVGVSLHNRNRLLSTEKRASELPDESK